MLNDQILKKKTKIYSRNTYAEDRQKWTAIKGQWWNALECGNFLFTFTM